MSFIEFESVYKRYQTGEIVIPAADGVDFVLVNSAPPRPCLPCGRAFYNGILPLKQGNIHTIPRQPKPSLKNYCIRPNLLTNRPVCG